MDDVLFKSPDVLQFVELAEKYIALVDSADDLTREEFLTQVHGILPVLYGTAICLPDAETTKAECKERRTTEAAMLLKDTLSAKIGENDLYKEIFDPYADDLPVSGTLSDDITDIYNDILDGLSCWRSGHYEDAVWDWRFGLRYHWGEHATGALRALRILIYDLYDRGM